MGILFPTLQEMFAEPTVEYIISVLSFGVLRFLFDHLVFYETYRRDFLGKLNERMGSGLLVLEGESID